MDPTLQGAYPQAAQAAQAPAPIPFPQAPAAPAPRQRTKAPLRVVYADDFTQTIDGVVYRPHAGEYVQFLASIRLETLLMAMRLKALEGLNMDAMGKEETAEFGDMLDVICRELSVCIRGWSWTDDAPDESGDFPVLPWTGDREANIALLRSRSMDEIMWLVASAFGGGAPAEGNATGA